MLPQNEPKDSIMSLTMSLYDWLTTTDQFLSNQLIDIDWTILLRDAVQSARWMRLADAVTNVYNPNETNNAVEKNV